MEDFMRATLRAVVLIACTGLLGMSAPFAAPAGRTWQDTAGPGHLVQQVQYGSYCERLRRACVSKEYRGEEGMGNCRRYRAECGGGSSYCERLRRACMYKEYRGEEGMGNCRRYRNECGGY
jgi:hypothetical protein